MTKRNATSRLFLDNKSLFFSPSLQVLKLYELSDDPNRKVFLDGLLKFMDDRGQPIKNTPQVASHVLDLFRLYFLVKEKGGVVKVCILNN